ncbi:MAG: hypothetical protein KQI35_18655 [Bacteroidetes bacterium]|nr:hypothetical protein [Bacteroidota bacterium]
MKLITTTILAVFTAFSIIAQTPQAFKYQTVLRNNTGEILANQNVSFQISILQGSTTGTTVYVEMHQTSTNDFGLASLEIGNGIVVSGIFSEIDWGVDIYFLQIELDETGGTNYQLMGTSQLLSVPYAFHSNTTSDTTRWRKQENGDLFYNTGNIGIGTENPDETSILDLSSNSKGILIPRLNQMAIESIESPTDGLMVYNTDDGRLYIFVGAQAAWRGIGYVSSIPLDAEIEIGNGSECMILGINGEYKDGVALTYNEYVSIAINVISPGSYSITTDTVNGYSFSTSGIFNSTGFQNIGLLGNGTPITPQNDLFTVSSINGGGTCTFDITVDVAFVCGDALVDNYEGMVQYYSTVQIGSQCWMAENLNRGYYIPSSNNIYNDGIVQKYCYGDNMLNCEEYGGIYPWDEIMNWVIIEEAQGICPDGWHIPSDSDWIVLIDYLGGASVAGDKLKEPGTTHWTSPNTGTNESGFTALPGGYLATSGYFQTIGSYGYFWTSTEYNSEQSIRYHLYNNSSSIVSANRDKLSGYSVRCIQD